MKELQAKDVLHRPLSSNFLTDVCKGISIGLATGLVVALFRWLIDQAMLFARFVYPLLTQPTTLVNPLSDRHRDHLGTLKLGNWQGPN
ncbi:hypothetical protein ACLOCA_08020 [Limosilactobacillus fermentum]|uniref:hypothetical protein n=1 Tax=Limosilactobacillus fermentum TaxID=1613 RepID=UPI002FD86DDE